MKKLVATYSKLSLVYFFFILPFLFLNLSSAYAYSVSQTVSGHDVTATWTFDSFDIAAAQALDPSCHIDYWLPVFVGNWRSTDYPSVGYDVISSGDWQASTDDGYIHSLNPMTKTYTQNIDDNLGGFTLHDNSGHAWTYYSTFQYFQFENAAEDCVINYPIISHVNDGSNCAVGAGCTIPLPENYFRTQSEQILFAPIVNIAPQLNTLSGSTINEGSTYTENGSFTDSDSSSWTATVDYGDGSGSQSLTLNVDKTFALSHVYQNIGTYTVAVSVTDNQGASATSQTMIVVIPTAGLPKSDLSHTNFSGADFSGQDISKADLSSATFNNVNFQNANLSKVDGSNSSFINDNFTGVNLDKGNFSNANFIGSNFTNATLTKANFSNANLTNVNFTGVNLDKGNFSGTIKTGIIWSNTICPNGTNSNNDGGTCVGQGGGL